MKTKSKFIWIPILIAIAVGAWFHGTSIMGVTQESADKAQAENDSALVALGTNSNREIPESSGLAQSKYVEDAVWTLNDSGNSNELFLLKLNGRMLAKIELRDAKNLDWEAMTRFDLDGKSYLIAGDVGDNSRSRKNYQLYVIPEPDLSEIVGDKPVARIATPIKLNFTYEDKAKNCEAIAVDGVGKQIWLVEKVYYNSSQKTPPGIYVLPLSIIHSDKPLVAKRIADFPPRSVTGMAFSPDGKYLIIRNYVNAHLYWRADAMTWEDVVQKTKPQTVVLPLQRQGEAICFSPDSKSVIVTSELNRQMIWKVGLEQYFSASAEK